MPRGTPTALDRLEQRTTDRAALLERLRRGQPHPRPARRPPRSHQPAPLDLHTHYRSLAAQFRQAGERLGRIGEQAGRAARQAAELTREARRQRPPAVLCPRTGRYRDQRGRFLPSDRYEREHILNAEAELRAEGVSWAEIDRLRHGIVDASRRSRPHGAQHLARQAADRYGLRVTSSEHVPPGTAYIVDGEVFANGELIGRVESVEVTGEIEVPLVPIPETRLRRREPSYRAFGHIWNGATGTTNEQTWDLRNLQWTTTAATTSWNAWANARQGTVDASYTDTRWQTGVYDWFRRATASSYVNDYYPQTEVRERPRFAVQYVIQARMLRDSQDPDALLGDAYERLERACRQRVEDYMANDQAWTGWVAQMTDVTYDDMAQHLRAVVYPTQPNYDGTETPVWLGWAREASELQPLQGYSPRPQRLTAAELEAKRIADAKRAWEGRQRQIIYANRQHSERLRYRIAERRAKQLLDSLLDEVQKADYERANGFRVFGSDGLTYWVSKGHAGNVYLLDEQGRDSERYCAHHYDGRMPDEDHMVTQKLLIECNVEAFLEVANRSTAYRQQRIPADEVSQRRGRNWLSGERRRRAA